MTGFKHTCLQYTRTTQCTVLLNDAINIKQRHETIELRKQSFDFILQRSFRTTSRMVLVALTRSYYNCEQRYSQLWQFGVRVTICSEHINNLIRTLLLSFCLLSSCISISLQEDFTWFLCYTSMLIYEHCIHFIASFLLVFRFRCKKILFCFQSVSIVCLITVSRL